MHAVHDAAGREAEGGLEKRRIGAFTAGAERRVGDNGVREARGPWKAGQLGYVGFDELHPAQDAFEGIGVRAGHLERVLRVGEEWGGGVGGKGGDEGGKGGKAVVCG